MKDFILNIVFVFLFSSVFYAQEKDDNSDFKNYSSSLFNSKQVALSIVSLMDKKEQKDLNLKIPSGIQIQQIGDLNKVTAILKSNETKIAVDQKGDYNQLFLDKNAKTITQNIVQKGNNNKISDLTLYTNYSVNMEMIQKGDNQNIQSIGTNSLSKNMRITQTGNGASIILINN
ncbi:hypothetical protein ASF10_08105 [Flavobacterium sp. Leaf82]|uniref:hypothetical protein n=1 Tax=unclassified Flavobacterium TaxID=196869 RepID=UPI0006FEF83F|nr:hypothetical protein [Flavobacterium sp. Leaf82]KQO22340.1 hypothetical protein ASF10_08105 [Flavobacterium sp. Leaf82]